MFMGLFLKIYTRTVSCFVEFTSHYLIEILLVIREWEREGMRITNGNGKGMGIKLVYRSAERHCPWAACLL